MIERKAGVESARKKCILPSFPDDAEDTAARNVGRGSRSSIPKSTPFTTDGQLSDMTG
jgi:hypothetical protein